MSACINTAFQSSSKMVHPFLLLQPPCSFYLDLDWLGQYWNCWEGKGRIYHHTGPVNTMYGLREGLAMVAEEGLENCWRRHRLAADTLQAGLADLGLEMFVPDPKARSADSCLLPFLFLTPAGCPQ